jgi:16S rRNA (cytidine1402-2'-O)-methyltransferase
VDDDVNGELVIVATPIGNLGDLSPRASAALRDADVVCCEDTRRTRALLSALGIPAGRRLVSLHEHNELSRAGWVADQVANGSMVCYVTDAGTPGVSDPGHLLVREVAARQLRVTAVPGPSAALAALVVSGLPTDRFCVEGFLPRRGEARTRRLAELAREERTTIVFEAPTRLAATLAELAATLGDRSCVMCRELTKLHEEVDRASLRELAARAREAPAPRGEVVLVIGGAVPSVVDDHDVARAVSSELASGSTVRDAASAVASSLGVSRRRAYEEALRQGPGDHS